MEIDSVLEFGQSRIKELKTSIVENFQAHLGNLWEEFTQQDISFVEEVAKDAANLQYLSLMGQSDETWQKEMAIINATLHNLTVARTAPIVSLFWRSVEIAGKQLVEIAVSTLIKAAVIAIV